MNERLIPYSVYLPVEHYERIKELAKQRKASALIRDAICMIIEDKDLYSSGYNKGIEDAAKAVGSYKGIQGLGVQGRYLDELLPEMIKELQK